MTRNQAIRLKCKDCIYDPKQSGTWVAQVEACIDTDCPLYEYRPKQRKSKNEEATDSEAEDCKLSNQA